jgi:hypothetical protein
MLSCRTPHMNEEEFQKNLKAMEAECEKDTKRLIESGERAGTPVSPIEADRFRRGFQAGWAACIEFRAERHKEIAKELQTKRAEALKQIREVIEEHKRDSLEQLRTQLSKSGPLTKREEEIFHYAYRQAELVHQPVLPQPKTPEPSVN